MSNQYAMDYGGDAPQQSGAVAAPPMVAGHPYQVVMPPQKKRVSAGTGMFFGIILCGGILYGAEMFAPAELRPSTATGSYGGRYAAEIKAHDLETHAEFMDWAEEVKVSVAQQQEQYRAAAQGMLNNYQAAYDRSRIYAQTTAQLQQDYVNQRTDIARQQQGTETVARPMGLVLPSEGLVYRFERPLQVAENAPLNLELGFAPQARLAWWRVVAGLILLAGLTVVISRTAASPIRFNRVQSPAQ